ncbi:major facilitator superfamily domain-containing protein [Lipomyces kononenkoae]|uniref:Major facilitator superfamily domain-containing protein n=1 Tax=Lipomyces kononenkoae TaxID=34357 RepID=A0ACC3SSZ8_LIPKO
MKCIIRSSDIEEFAKMSSIPGTVHLLDLQDSIQAKHASGNQNEIVLIPTPSDDPEDPLNWSRGRKLLSAFCVCVYTFMVGFTSAAIYSVLEPISNATDLSLGDLNAGTGYMFLLFGWGCLVWQPLASQYGKRPIYLLSILVTGAIMVWAPYTKSDGQWIANKILQGFFGAPIESLCEISMADICFTHERGTAIAAYGLTLIGSSFLAPVIAGFIANSQGWQWVLYWCAIFCAIGFVFLFLFMEETNYHLRATVGVEAREDQLSQVESKFQSTKEGTNLGDHHLHHFPSPQKTRISSSVVPQEQSSSRTTTLAKKLRLFQPGVFSHPNRIHRMMVRPLVFLSFPVIVFAGFSYGSSLVWFNILNGTASLILSSPPYNLSPSIVGVSYISPLLGAFIAAAYTGVFGSWFVIRMARWNKGIMEPEHRLWLFMASVLLVPFGLILWGIGAEHHIHWFGLIFAMAIISISNVIGLQISVSYCIDSYPDLSSEAMVTVIIIRNTMSFAVNYGITPWVMNMGLQNAFLVAAFAGMAQVLTFLIFVKWGRVLRARSAQKYLEYSVEMLDTGLAH